MTLNQLHRLLERHIKDGHGRWQVSVDKQSFWHPLDEVGIHDLESAELRWVPLCDDDGGQAYTKAGIERGSWQLVLAGSGREPLTRKNAKVFRRSDPIEDYCANCHGHFDAHHKPNLTCR